MITRCFFLLALIIPLHSFGQHIPVFKPKLGVCTSIKNHEVVAAAGFDYIEESVQRFLVPLEPDEVFVKNMELLNESTIPILACNGFIPGKLKSTGPDADHDAILAYADTAFRRAAKAGIKVIVFGSSGSRNVPTGFDHHKGKEQFTALLAKMGPVAAKYGIIVAIEPLRKGESNIVNRVIEGFYIALEVGHPNIRVLGDVFHMMRETEQPVALKMTSGWLVHMHLAEIENRTSPGVKGDNFRPYLKALKAIGYTGGISLEGRWGDDFPTELIRARAYLHGQINTLN